MEYYILEQDKRYYPVPYIKDFHKHYNRNFFEPSNAYKIPDRNVVFSNSNEKLRFIDYLEVSVFLISETLMDVFFMYDRAITFKQFCILNNLQGEYKNYYAPVLKLGTSVENKSIVKMRYGQREVLIVRLDVVESILRRDVNGIKFKKFEGSLGSGPKME